MYVMEIIHSLLLLSPWVAVEIMVFSQITGNIPSDSTVEGSTQRKSKSVSRLARVSSGRIEARAEQRQSRCGEG